MDNSVSLEVIRTVGPLAVFGLAILYLIRRNGKGDEAKTAAAEGMAQVATQLEAIVKTMAQGFKDEEATRQAVVSQHVAAHQEVVKVLALMEKRLEDLWESQRGQPR